jgi:hypothetical protein
MAKNWISSVPRKRIGRERSVGARWELSPFGDGELWRAQANRFR